MQSNEIYSTPYFVGNRMTFLRASGRSAGGAGLNHGKGLAWPPASPATFSSPKLPSSNTHLSSSQCCLSALSLVPPRASRAPLPALLCARLSSPSLPSFSHGSRSPNPPTPAFPQPASSASPLPKVSHLRLIVAIELRWFLMATPRNGEDCY